MFLLTCSLNRQGIFNCGNVQRSISYKHKVNDLDKRFLVWTGRYRYIREVPQYVAPSVVEKARSKFRIFLANAIMVSALVASVFVVRDGQAARDRGETLQKQNLEWHRRIKEQENEAK